MTDRVFNIAKGRVAELWALGAASDALVAIPLETSGLEADSVLIDKDDFAAVVSGATNEQTTMGRKTLATPTVATDDTNDWVTVDSDNPVWTAATGNAVSKLVVCYDADTGAGTDANLIPLLLMDFVATPNGSDITYVVNSTGWYKAA